MGSELTTIHHPVATQQGALALRGIARSQAWGETSPSEVRRWLTSALRAQLPMAIEEAQAKLKRSVMADARRFLLPALALVAPAGMSAEDQTAWLASALDGLSGIPADLLERGCAAAKRVADHPSKIVKAIYTEVGAEWERRKGDLANVRRIAAAADGANPEPRPWEDLGNFVRRYATPEEVAAIKEEIGLKTQPYPEPTKTRGPLREPTAADYAEVAKAMGIDLTKPTPVPDFDPTGMTIEQIQAKVEANRAERSRQLEVRPSGAVPLDQRPMPDWDEMERYGS